MKPGISLAIAAFALSFHLLAASPQAGITVGLRYDDYSSASPGELESRIVSALEKRKLSATFGVIPQADSGGFGPAPRPLDSAKVELLRRGQASGTIEVALHGYTHRTLQATPKSEFTGLPGKTQLEILTKGKNELDTLFGPVTTFIPPWNSYDTRTLSALSAAGFKAISAAPDGPGLGGGEIRFIPATVLFPDIREAVTAARRLERGSPGASLFIVAYFHPYEFKEAGQERSKFTMADFETTLDWLAAQPDVAVKTLGRMALDSVGGRSNYGAYSRPRGLLPSGMERSLRPAYRVYPLAGFPVPGGTALLWGLVILLHSGIFLTSGFAAILCLRLPGIPRRFHAALPRLRLWVSGVAATSVGWGILVSDFATVAVSCAILGAGYLGMRKTSR